MTEPLVPEYTMITVAAVIAVLFIEFLWLRTGIFRTRQYWFSMIIVFAFQVIVDGWLTKLDDPIVLYDDRQTLGIRFPWDIPIEDFGFGFALVTSVILIWHRLGPSRILPRPTEKVIDHDRS